MKISKEQAARNRERIVSVASRLFRRRGVEGVSVAEVMEEAGFTHGGFYNHFADKEALAVEALVTAFAGSVSTAQERTATGLGPYVKSYLSTAHRDGEDGCLFTALATDAARHEDLQPAFAAGLQNTIELFTEALQRSGVMARAAARKRAVRLVSEMVGALTLSRAVRVAEPRLSAELLRASRTAGES